MRHFLFLHADSRVCDTNPDLPAVTQRVHPHEAVLRVLERILDENENQLLQIS